MNEILEQVYQVYGNGLANSRSLYSAHTKSPVSALSINKAFGNWNKFYQEYLTFCLQKRSAVKVVEKMEIEDDEE